MTSLAGSSLPSLSGYLQQKAGFFGRWKKFWFVLSDGILYKFKTKETVQPMEEFDLCGRRNSQKFSSSFNSSSSSLGEVSNNSSSSSLSSTSGHQHHGATTTSNPHQPPARVLHNGKHVCGKDFSIALFQEGSETLILLAADQQEHAQWMNALNLSLPKGLRISPSQRDLNDSHLTNSISNSSLSGLIGGASNGGIGMSTGMIGGVSSSGSGSGSGFGLDNSMNDQAIPHKQTRMESMLHVLEAVLDPTVISDEKGVIVGFNKSAEELFGWRRDEILSKNVSILMPSMYARFHDGYLERFKKNNDKRLIGKPRRMLAKHKQGHNFPIELSLGEIPSDEGSNDNLAFVAVFRPSYEESILKNSASSASELSENGSSESSPISQTSESRDDFSTRSRGSNPSISSYSLDHDIEKSIHTNREKLDQRLNGFLKSMKGVIDNEYGVLEKKFVVLQQKVNVLEQENERLFQQTEKQHEHIKLLEEELGVLQKASDKFSLVQLLKNESTFKIFVEYCSRNNTQDLCMFYKEAEDYKNKYSHIEGVVSSMEEEAKSIYEKYLSDNSGKNVNIPYDSKSHVKYHLLTPTSDMFDFALNDTLALLKELSFEKFCESGSGKATLQQLIL